MVVFLHPTRHILTHVTIRFPPSAGVIALIDWRPRPPAHLAGGFLLGAGLRRSRLGMTLSPAVPIQHGMSQPPSSSPPAKPKLTAQERRARKAARLKMIRLRMTIGRESDHRGIATPAAIGAALGMPAAEATALLTRKQWRDGDVALLGAAAVRLGVQVERSGSYGP